MTHVEIYYGGTQTLGARYIDGVVSIFDSYKFDSTLYYDINCYFKSIDTWLEGICKLYYDLQIFNKKCFF